VRRGNIWYRSGAASRRGEITLARTPRFSWLALLAALATLPARAGENEALRARIDELERRVAELSAALAETKRECAQSPHARGWEDPARWAALEKGMSRFQVFELLGEPGKVASYDGFERWEYPDFKGGRVNFDDAGRVAGWRTP
jgi:hypothetical protein